MLIHTYIWSKILSSSRDAFLNVKAVQDDISSKTVPIWLHPTVIIMTPLNIYLIMSTSPNPKTNVAKRKGKIGSDVIILAFFITWNVTGYYTSKSLCNILFWCNISNFIIQRNSRILYNLECYRLLYIKVSL